MLMDLQKIIFINMLLEVYDDREQLYYKSIVQEINEASFAIGVPMAERKGLIMLPNSRWTFRTTLKDALYLFEAKVIGHTTSGDLLLFQIEWPKKMERYQRRYFFRLPAFLDLCFWVLPEGEEPRFKGEVPDSGQINNLGDPEKAVALNISGGGILLLSPRKLSKDVRLLLQISLNAENLREALFIQAEIVREEVQKETGITRYYYGLCFVNITEKLREKIIKHIFILTRERKCKGG
jgi:c-di-GMP-binding flagellar brake protein YcgR